MKKITKVNVRKEGEKTWKLKLKKKKKKTYSKKEKQMKHTKQQIAKTNYKDPVILGKAYHRQILSSPFCCWGSCP